MEYQMVFHAGYCDRNTRDVVRISKSVKRARAARQVFFTFRKSSKIPSVWNFDDNILQGKPIWYVFYKITTALVGPFLCGIL